MCIHAHHVHVLIVKMIETTHVYMYMHAHTCMELELSFSHSDISNNFYGTEPLTCFYYKRFQGVLAELE